MEQMRSQVKESDAPFFIGPSIIAQHILHSRDSRVPDV